MNSGERADQDWLLHETKTMYAKHQGQGSGCLARSVCQFVFGDGHVPGRLTLSRIWVQAARSAREGRREEEVQRRRKKTRKEDKLQCSRIRSIYGTLRPYPTFSLSIANSSCLDEVCKSDPKKPGGGGGGKTALVATGTAFCSNHNHICVNLCNSYVFRQANVPSWRGIVRQVSG